MVLHYILQLAGQSDLLATVISNKYICNVSNTLWSHAGQIVSIHQFLPVCSQKRVGYEINRNYETAARRIRPQFFSIGCLPSEIYIFTW